MGDQHPLPGARVSARRTVRPQSLAAVQVYRPGLAFAATLLLAPAIVAVGAAGLALLLIQRVPPGVPLALGAVLPIAACGWLGVARVRIGPDGIAASRPGRLWREIPWALIEHARQRGPWLTLVASDGQRIQCTPALLGDGARLFRELLLRLPPQVLDARMAHEAETLLAERILPTAEGGLTGALHARPRTRWRAGSLVLAADAVVAGVVGAVRLPLPSALASVALAVAALGGALLAYGWCAQVLDASDAGLTVRYPLRRSSDHIAWSKVQLVEHSPGERVLRLRGDKRLVCAGPALLRPPERDLMRAFLHAYCVDRGVPVARRRWLFSARSVRHG